MILSLSSLLAPPTAGLLDGRGAADIFRQGVEKHLAIAFEQDPSVEDCDDSPIIPVADQPTKSLF